MKSVFIFLVAETASIAAVIIAGLIALKGLDGWGWFLFMAILLSVSSYKGVSK